MNIDAKSIYKALNELIVGPDKEKGRFRLDSGFLAYTPASNKNDEHRLTLSFKGVFPTRKENQLLMETLLLVLRRQTFKTGCVVVSEIHQNNNQKLGIYGCTIFKWSTASTAELLKLNRSEANHATWWLEMVQEKKDNDRKRAQQLEGRHDRASWNQVSLIK